MLKLFFPHSLGLSAFCGFFIFHGNLFGSQMVKQAKSVVNLLSVGVKGKQDLSGINVPMVYFPAQCFATAIVPTVTNLTRPIKKIIFKLQIYFKHAFFLICC